jgi:serine/threonine protein kinase
MPFVADEFTGRRFGKYEVLCRLAVGGMAEIFLGFPLGGPFAYRPVVLKRILSDHREDPSSLQMLIDEAKLTAQLSHRHVAQVLDLEVDGEDVILVIELIQGANLEELADVVTQRKEPLPLGFVISAIRDAALGLSHAHSHKDGKGAPMPIIHRDVTPRNLMVTFDGVGKVLDFGIARAVGSSRRTVAGMVRGTAAYMSPEQAIDGKVDTRSDIFSLGIVFHELLVGQRLFGRGNPGKEMAAVYEAEIPMPSAANKRVPRVLDAIVLRALERSVSRRYQSPSELIRDLQAASAVSAWPAERSGELVQQLFVDRQQKLKALLARIPDDGPGAVTDVSRERLSDQELETEMRTVVGMPSAPPTTEVPMSTVMPKTKVPSGATRRPMRREVDTAAATTFYTPNFVGASPTPDGDRITDEGPVPKQLKRGPTLTTEPGVPGPSASASDPVLPQVDHATSTRRAPPPRARGLLLAIGALLAMVLGALGGVLVYRSMAPSRPQVTGVGRLSLLTDRPAEVRLGSTVLKAPFADVYLAAGRQSLELRDLGSEGAWKKLEVEVAPDRVTRLEIKLDSLAPGP